MIEIRNLTFAYEKDNPVLKDISFTAQDGECIGLIGANGAGKSTLMKVMLGLLDGNGSVIVDGTPVMQDTLAEIRRKLGFVLQNSDSQMFMPTVIEDMLFGLLNYGMSRQEALQRADSVLKELGQEKLRDLYNHKISGGEKRMAAVATVLAMDPEVLLMDEPTSALDPYNRRIIIETIRKLPRTKIITSHDLDMIYDTCGRVILLSQGSVAADGPAEEILKDRELLEANRMELPLRFQR